MANSETSGQSNKRTLKDLIPNILAIVSLAHVVYVAYIFKSGSTITDFSAYMLFLFSAPIIFFQSILPLVLKIFGFKAAQRKTVIESIFVFINRLEHAGAWVVIAAAVLIITLSWILGPPK
ncbi:hypothetical protein LCGC14_2906180 [marine sediment metagenome]|uniref:Uncharacterized protein n=1 Tax=marine sediment metagenome TaxID=412755 RepID=A0A0F9A0Q7_9ZZZZ